ncbi:hypothetical protein AB0G35_25375 [Streptomyces sp. NPDC021749]|uniref:hypothetical protein n=1 Tax=Streptomyces sp. NPDC021749 TaxID=3154905 RepID=UPI0033E6F5A6
MTRLALETPAATLQASGLHPVHLAASDLAHHLLVDFVLKILIVVVALVVLGLGMAVIWRRVGRPEGRQRRNDE